MENPEKAQSIPLLDSSVPQIWGSFYRDFFKRFFDVAFGILLLPFIVPVLLILIVLIKLDSRGPAIYKSERVGLDGKTFFIFKLRTMCQNAEEKLAEVLSQNESLRLEWEDNQKLKNDPRITRIGKIIRKLSLDELPQIFNVLKGEMSFVGPRPIVQTEIARYGRHFGKYKSVLPGLTGLWQINGRSDTEYEKRVALDVKYIHELNFNLDLKIIGKTIPAAFLRKGAY
jgi:undecaprenyl-phosphate galactose phosphotransferase